MLTCLQATGARRWLDVAHDCGGRLESFACPERPGVYTSEVTGTVSPDLLLGYAGVGSFYLRLADPHVAPDLVLRGADLPSRLVGGSSGRTERSRNTRNEMVSRLLAQVDAEPGFRELLLRDPAAALVAASLQGAWTPELAGEDVLRRLAGASLPGDARVWT